VEPSDVSDRLCIVGGGPSGLIAARALLRAGVAVEVLERNSSLGGIWDIDSPTSPVYESCNFISDREHSGFIGYRMPAHLSEYPTWAEVRDYIRDFARDYDLERYVKFNHEVVGARFVGSEETPRWEVRLADGSVSIYRGVVWACGQQQEGHRPRFAGEETFSGAIIHSSQYRSGADFSGKRVLVVGAGNSGVDIACDAAIFGDSAVLSMRRGYWWLPKWLFGRPTAFMYDEDVPLPPGITLPENATYDERRAFVASCMGDLTRIGLAAPDHPLGATHPIANEQVVHQITHGRLRPAADVDHIEGSVVHFTDGRREEFDLIVAATGYTVTIPWLSSEYYDTIEGEPDFHLGTISLRAPALYAVGLLHFPGHTYAVWDRLAQIMVADVVAQTQGTDVDRARRIRHEYNPDLRGGKYLVDTPRNRRQVDTPTLEQMFVELRDDFGIPMPDRFDEQFYRELRVG